MGRLRRLCRNCWYHRQRRTLTQHELEKLSGVSRPTIAALELGYRRAHPRTAAKLAKALKVKPHELE